MSDVDLDGDEFFADYYKKAWSKKDERENENINDELQVPILGSPVANSERHIDNGP